jgi:hypothetical protein
VLVLLLTLLFGATQFQMLVLLLPLLLSAALASDSYYVHLALSSDPTKAYVQWRTDDVASPALVHYGATPGALTSSSNGTSWTFTDSRTYNLRMATLSGLTPGAKVYYSVGDNATVLSFTATRARAQFSEEAPLKIAFFGDLGWQNAQALPYLVEEAAAGAFDHFIHVGECVACILPRALSSQPVALSHTLLQPSLTHANVALSHPRCCPSFPPFLPLPAAMPMTCPLTMA